MIVDKNGVFRVYFLPCNSYIKLVNGSGRFKNAKKHAKKCDHCKANAAESQSVDTTMADAEDNDAPMVFISPEYDQKL